MRTWVIVTEYVEPWFDSLDDETFEQILAALTLLTTSGPSLGRPLVDSIRGSRHHNLKELRVGSSGGSEIRILFIFDPMRKAILLVGGDKSRQWKSWYHENIPRAETIYDKHLKELENE